MNKKYLVPMLAAALFVGACEEDDAISVGAQANVRFVNAISGSSNLAFTANGSMAGSALPFGQASNQCTTVNSGSARTFAFGTANSAGTGIQGTALQTFNQDLTAGADYTVFAAGTASNPQFFVLNDINAGTVSSGQAAVRFINLVPNSTTGTATNFNVFSGTSTTGTPTVSTLSFGGSNATTFRTVTSGSNTFTLTNPTTGTALLTNGTVNLQGGQTNTVAILPATSGTGFQLVNVTGC